MPDMETLHRELKAARQELHNLQVLQLQPGKSPERLEMLHQFERSARSPSFRFLSRTTTRLEPKARLGGDPRPVLRRVPQGFTPTRLRHETEFEFQ
jgi:hypothetical protein